MLFEEEFLTVTLPWNPDPQSWVTFQSTFISLVDACAGLVRPAVEIVAAARAAIIIVGRLFFTCGISPH